MKKSAHQTKTSIVKKEGTEITKVPKGELVILKERCKGCEYCIAFCPKDILEMSREYNSKGYHFPVVKFPQQCTACNQCGLLCPDFAIYFQKSESNYSS